MNGLRRHAWWGLLVIWLIAFVFGVTDVVRGADADPAINRAHRPKPRGAPGGERSSV